MQKPKRTPGLVKSARGRSGARLGMPRTLRAGRPDRDARAVLRALKLSVRPPEAYSVQRLRGVWRLLAQVLGRRLAMASVTEHFIDGPGGPIAIRVYADSPSDELRPAFLWCHGGGFVLGGLESADPICRNIAREAGCVVVAVRYRLAPEHLLSAGREDFLAALDWVARHGKTLGIDTKRLAIGGDSAGGNICAAVAQARRGDKSLRLQVLVYPATDLLQRFPSAKENAEGYLMTAGLMDHFERLAVTPVDATQPWFSPGRNPDLRGLAPALIVTAGYDPIRDDGLDYAGRLRAAAVPVELLHYAGQIHGFLSFDAVIGAGRDGLQRIGQALKAAFGGDATADRTLEVCDQVPETAARLDSLRAAGEEVTSTLLFTWVSYERWLDTLSRRLSNRMTDLSALMWRPLLAPAHFVRHRVMARLDRLAVRQTYPEAPL